MAGSPDGVPQGGPAGGSVAEAEGFWGAVGADEVLVSHGRPVCPFRNRLRLATDAGSLIDHGSSKRRHSALVSVVMPDPKILLVASLRRPVEPLIHRPRDRLARARRRNTCDRRPRPPTRTRSCPAARGCTGHIGAGHGRADTVALRRRPRRHVVRLARLHRLLAPVVVLDAPLALLLLREVDVEVGVEVAAERRGPGEASSPSAA